MPVRGDDPAIQWNLQMRFALHIMYTKFGNTNGPGRLKLFNYIFSSSLARMNFPGGKIPDEEYDKLGAEYRAREKAGKAKFWGEILAGEEEYDAELSAMELTIWKVLIAASEALGLPGPTVEFEEDDDDEDDEDEIEALPEQEKARVRKDARDSEAETTRAYRATFPRPEEDAAGPSGKAKKGKAGKKRTVRGG